MRELLVKGEPIARTLIAVLLIISAVDHLENPMRFLDAVYSYRIVKGEGGALVAMLLPMLQLQIAMCFALNIYRAVAWHWCAVFFLSTVVAQLFVIIRGLHIKCGCFGTAHMNVGSATLAVSGLLLCISLGSCWVNQPRNNGPA